MLLPFYGADDLYEQHPPLREYTWSEDNLPETAVEYPLEQTALFVPGLASIAPCTSENYNLKLGNDNFWSASSDDGGVHRATHPHAGAFSYRHNVTYIAVRDIAAGEELTVNCDDNNFDGGAYFLERFESTKSDDHVTCLDQNLRVEKANKKTPEGGKDDPMGMGLFAKRDLAKGDNIISSPLVPVHRKVLDINDNDDVNNKQLMLNYVFGHPESDLLLLPIGPMVNFINHRRESDGGANAEIRWHHLSKNWKSDAELVEYHDIQLLDLPADVVTNTFGRGLVMDIVATKMISEGDEIYLDYGKEWQDAWDKHSASFEYQKEKLPKSDKDYISAENYNRIAKKEFEEYYEQNKDRMETPISYYYRTVFEEENFPLPEGMEFYCFYSPREEQEEGQLSASALLRDSAEESDDDDRERYSWFEHSVHNCLRPCAIIERYPSEMPEFLSEDDFEEDFDPDEASYTVLLFAGDNDRVVERCGIPTDYDLEDIPHSQIRLLGSPYSTDVMSPFAFRHEIGVPEGFFPKAWKKGTSRLRRSPTVTLDDFQSAYKKTKQTNKD